MTEENRGSFFMRDFKRELFVVLIRNPPKMVAEFVSVASIIRKTLEIWTRQYNRSFSATSYADIQALRSTGLRETIGAILQE